MRSAVLDTVPAQRHHGEVPSRCGLRSEPSKRLPVLRAEKRSFVWDYPCTTGEDKIFAKND